MENVIETFATIQAYLLGLMSGRLPREYEPDGYYAAAMNPDGSILALRRHADLCESGSYEAGFWSKGRVRLCMLSRRDRFNITRRGIDFQFRGNLTQKQVSAMNALARNWATDGASFTGDARNNCICTESRAELNSFLRQYLPVKVKA